jgi:integrase
VDKEEKLNNSKIKVDFHSFRHTFASKLIGEVKDSMVDKIMGHSGSSENKRTYNKVEIEKLKIAIEKLDIEKINFANIKNLLK